MTRGGISHKGSHDVGLSITRVNTWRETCIHTRTYPYVPRSVRAHTHTYTHTCTHTCIIALACTHTHTHKHTHAHTCTHVHTRAHTHTHTYAKYSHTHTHTYTHTHIHTYTHTYTYTHTHARSLEKMAEDYAQFSSACALLSKAKLYNNTFRPVLLPVPVASAIIPVLHLDLGVFPWIFDVFTREVRLLDMQLAEQCDAEEQDSGRFRALSTANRKLSGCKTAFSEATAKATALKNHLHFIVLFGQQQVMAIEALAGVLQPEVEQAQKIAENELAKLRHSNDVLGPCEASIEPEELQKNIIHRQAYRGGAFVGDHIHRALKPAVITAITEAPEIVIGDRCPALRNDGQVVSERYKSLFSQYAACRSSFSHFNKCGEEELQQLELFIASFLQKCRSEVVERGLGHITPKLHLLEEHTVPLIRRVHVGLGLLSEQGAEGIHAEFNLLEKRNGSIPGKLERLKCCCRTTPRMHPARHCRSPAQSSIEAADCSIAGRSTSQSAITLTTRQAREVRSNCSLLLPPTRELGSSGPYAMLFCLDDLDKKSIGML